MDITTSLLCFLLMLLLPSFVIAGLFYVITNFLYMRTTYYKVTNIPYLEMCRDAGRYGEYLTYKRLKKYEEKGAKFLFNCYLPCGDGKTTEVDVIMLYTSGIYVFESKNYSGWIFGDEKVKMWTQTLANGHGKRARKEYFFNPVMQNETHIKWIKSTLDNDALLCHSIIVFSERCKLKNIKISNENIGLVNRQQIQWLVKQLDDNHKDVFNTEEINYFYDILYPFTQVSEEDKEQHIKNIKKKYPQNIKNAGRAEVEFSAKENVCPRCGKQLVVRTTKKGVNKGEQFLGCSSFPDCRYIEKM